MKGNSVKDLSIDELRSLIRTTVEEALEDRSEDLTALASEPFLRSIEEARADLAEGRLTPIEDLLDADR